MELFDHPDPRLTRWIIENDYLESPFVVVDVGCQGGEHVRWRWLGQYLEVHGFDPLAEAIDALDAAKHRPGKRHFYNMALGNEEGERELFVQDNSFASSLYQQGEPRLSADEGTHSNRERRLVSIRKLDSLFKEGVIPRADFIKLDCEGFEPEVLKGAQEFLGATRPLGVETETNFNVSPILPRTHFIGLYDELVEHRLLLHDLAFARAPCSSFIQSFARETAPRTGRPSTFNVLFARDLPAERDSPMQYIVPPLGEQVAGDTVLKSAIMLELFGLSDCAYDTLASYSDVLAASFDLEQALTLLRTSAADDMLRDAIHAMHASASWRVTAPLRALGSWTRRARR
jgi:FkbM family methyltransferase